MNSVIGTFLRAGHPLSEIEKMTWDQLMTGYACMVQSKLDDVLPILNAMGANVTTGRKPSKSMRAARSERALESFTGGIAANPNIRHNGYPWEKSRNHPRYQPMPKGWHPELPCPIPGFEDVDERRRKERESA